MRLGRVKVYLLDTDIEPNAEWARDLSARLYVGELESRLQQELVLVLPAFARSVSWTMLLQCGI